MQGQAAASSRKIDLTSGKSAMRFYYSEMEYACPLKVSRHAGVVNPSDQLARISLRASGGVADPPPEMDSLLGCR